MAASVAPVLGRFWAWTQQPHRRGPAMAAAPAHLAAGAVAWFRYGETAFWAFVGAWWAVWAGASVAWFVRSGARSQPASASSASPSVAFALVVLPVLVPPDRQLPMLVAAVVACGSVAAVLVAFERRRLRALPPPPGSAPR